MLLLSLALTQVVSAYSPERIDLTVPQPCVAGQKDGGEVVVCANRNGESPYRLNQPAPQSSKAIPDAEVQIGEGVSIAAQTEGADVGGFPSNRAMIRLKIKF